MTIFEIKQSLGLLSLAFEESIDPVSGDKWHSAFDNNARVNVTVHDELFQQMIENRAIDSLALKFAGDKVSKGTEDKPGSPYKKWFIVQYKNTSGVF